MIGSRPSKLRLMASLCAPVAGAAAALFAQAGEAAAQVIQTAPAVDTSLYVDLQQMREQLATQNRRLQEQADLLARQAEALKAQQSRLEAQDRVLQRLAAAAPDQLADLRGTGAAPSAAAGAPAGAPAAAGAPAGPVGEAPPPPEVRVETAALPEGSGVLTRPHSFVVDPSIDYTHTTANRLVFRGIELVPGVQLGAIDASDSDRSATVATLAVRYGLTNRVELEARVPYMRRSDRINVVQQRDQTVTREILLEKSRLADIEFTGRYQINRARPGRPVYVANLRVKTDTGSNPYEIPRDQYGIATALATGSGFWGVEPSVSFLFPTDPVVIYGSVGYFYHMARDINRVIGDVPVGRVNPGDSLAAGLGFGMAVNDRFSFSLGFRMNYIYATRTELGTTVQWSKPLQVGTFQFGGSYVLTPRTVLSASFEMGATADAPDVRFVIRAPTRF